MNPDTLPPAPGMAELTRVFARIGLLSFGGPAAQIALMQRELVQERTWLTEQAFLRALSLCMLLPGPEAMQLATYAGWRLRGTAGGIVAGLLFVLPGATVILLLALLYGRYGALPSVEAAFLGIKAAVIVIVLQALQRLSAKALSKSVAWAIAAAAFFALFVLDAPYPLIIACAGLAGAVLIRPVARTAQPTETSRHQPWVILLVWGTLWMAPVLCFMVLDQHFLVQVALFFSKLAVVSFGGAYAVLAYMTQTVVSDFGWITTDQMVDALGLAETTPGPLILVTQFVAMLAGLENGGTGLAIAAGAATLWVTFIPCFLWIFLAAPYLDQIARRPRLETALQGITAAVVGVIFNLLVWFSIHVLFVETQTVSGIASPLPAWEQPDLIAVALVILAVILMLVCRRGIAQTLIAMAAAGYMASYL